MMKLFINRTEIAVPAPFGEQTLWEYYFNSDDNGIYHTFETHKDPIQVYSCSFASM